MARLHAFLPILIADLVVTIGVAGSRGGLDRRRGRWFVGFTIGATIWLSAESLAGIASLPEPTLSLTKVVSPYVGSLAGLVLLLRTVLRSRRLHRCQVIALTVALVVPIVANVLYMLGPIAVDITPLTFVVSGSSLGVAIFRYRLGDVTPVARGPSSRTSPRACSWSTTTDGSSASTP